jgi:hypothetical protein
MNDPFGFKIMSLDEITGLLNDCDEAGQGVDEVFGDAAASVALARELVSRLEDQS